MPWRERSEGSISYNGVLISYKLHRSKRRRKTFAVSVDKNGVRVAVPYRTPNRRVQAFLTNHASWILKKLEKVANQPPPKIFITGETMPYLGRNVHLTVTRHNIETARVRFNRWRFLVDVPKTLERDALTEEIRGAFLRWYVPRAGERTEASVNRWWKTLGRGERSQIIIGNQRSRWGSCAADGTLRFNWRLVMTPPQLLDYVVVHELAHLHVRNHSSDFWNVVKQAMPDALERRRRLREAGRSLPM